MAVQNSYKRTINGKFSTTNNKLNPHMASTPGVEPGPHWWEASALHHCANLASPFVVGSLPCSERFSPGTPVFPSPQKPTLPNSNSIWNSRTRFNFFYSFLNFNFQKSSYYYLSQGASCNWMRGQGKKPCNFPGRYGHFKCFSQGSVV